MDLDRRTFLGVVASATALSGCLSNGPGMDAIDPGGGDPTTTASDGDGTATATTTAGPTGRLLAPGELDDGWTYADRPSVADDGRLLATYRTSGEYDRRLELVVWPCEGQTLEDLGGECSIEAFARRQREREGVSTTAPDVGEDAIAYWEESSPETNLEAVVDGYVFRFTEVPASASGLPPRDRRVAGLRRIATRQAEKLSGTA